MVTKRHLIIGCGVLLLPLFSGVVTLLLLIATSGNIASQDESKKQTRQQAVAKRQTSNNLYKRYDAFKPTTRAVFDQPFASTSIWNMPIGNAARYIDAKLQQMPGGEAWATMPYADPEYIFNNTTAPLTPIYYSSAGWSGQDRCATSENRVVETVPMPSDFVLPSDGQNNIGVFLLEDRRTIAQVQPLARCQSGGVATTMVNFSRVDLYGEGITGAHGGSNLSGLGGSLRVGELKKGGLPPRHAIKINVYAMESLSACAALTDCYRWPASTADNYALERYGKEATGEIPSAMKMGALLAIPKSVDLASLNLQTEPARQLAWTLQHFGAYIVDDTYSPGFGISVQDGPEGSFIEQFEKEYGYSFTQKAASNNPWRKDMQLLIAALHVVDDNSQATVGGSGERLTWMAPSLVEPN